MFCSKQFSRWTSRYCTFVASSSSCCCRFYSSHEDVANVNDIVWLKHRNNSRGKSILTPRLQSGKKTRLERDSVSHDEIIGKGIGLGIATTQQNVQYRIHRPTLGEYTDSSPRVVTPIYSQDAALIVSLLDLHPTTPGSGGEKLEIFEAGTGHGALTLHLSRAIHAANPLPPTNINSNIPADGALARVLDEFTVRSWRASRRAVVHTLDISELHSQHAERVIKNYRGGMYSHNIDFHVGAIDEYLSSRLGESNGQPFLDHAILDLPDTHVNLDIVCKALKPNGRLITFCPSITQVNTCVLHTKDNKVPLFLDSVLEIGGPVGVGGREWDVRPVQPRASVKASSDAQSSESDESITGEAAAAAGGRWELICRPKVGVKIVGGGFLGLWRKMVPED